MDKGIAISSRVRVARNIRGTMFPQKMSESEALKIDGMVRKAMEDCEGFIYQSVGSLSDLDRISLVENRLISKELLLRPRISSFFLSGDKTLTIMVNEEDQIRIQSISTGLDLETAWEECSRMDDMLGSKLEYAFDEEFGYITSCPTNTGTGLRASVMVHLPLLVENGLISTMVNTLGKMGIVIRGIYGEGSKAIGNLFQISNQTTLGETEEESIQKLKNMVEQIMIREKNARKILLKNRKIEIEDRIFRSLGMLKNARIMTTDESMVKLSDVRIGIDMGILDIDIDSINKLIIDIQPGNIQKLSGSEMLGHKRDIKRAELLRERLS